MNVIFSPMWELNGVAEKVHQLGLVINPVVVTANDADIFSGKNMHMFYEFTTKELFPDAAKCFSKYFCAMQNIFVT